MHFLDDDVMGEPNQTGLNSPSGEGAESPPLVSIVTPSLNMAKYLGQTIESVLTQSYPRIEYIVVDGGSTDGTLDLLEKYKDRLKYFSGKDRGASDAINNGFKAGRGSILAWLSADDWYYPGAVRLAVESLAAAPEACAAYGDAHWVDAAGEILGLYPTQTLNLDRLKRECCISQPACFFRRSAFEAIGGLDSSLASAFDYDLWIRMAREWPFKRVPAMLAASRMHRANKTLGNRHQVFEEGIQILRKHFSYAPVGWIYAYLCCRLGRRDTFPEPPPPYPPEYLLSLPVGLRRNSNAMGRYLREWTRGLLKGAADVVLGRTRF